MPEPQLGGPAPGDNQPGPVAEWYSFDHPHGADAADLRSRLGGKGAGLAEMVTLGIPVPPGFTIPTAVCLDYLDGGWTAAMRHAVDAGLDSLQRTLGKRLGDPEAPLLVSVRSGAAISMPGMMDTVLNAGMTPDVARGLERVTGDADFAWDTYMRAITSYAQIVLGVETEQLASILAAIEDSQGAEITEAAAIAYSDAVRAAGFVVPEDPGEQIAGAVRAVFASWQSDRAKSYRERQNIDDSIGTAATVQAMVFGNMGSTSGTGVAFSRDPSTGEPGLVGDFLVNAQGEDVVAGTHNTMPMADMHDRWPDLWNELVTISDALEQQCQDMVDLEFTIENGTLWLLQTRVAKRSPRATFRTAIDMAESERFASIDRAVAVERCRELLADPPMAVETSSVDDGDLVILGTGLAASPGLAVGVLSIDPDDAVERHARGERVILAREETSPNDVHGMGASVGLVTTLGGMVSHAAVVARAWGLAAVVGCEGLSFADGRLIAGDRRVAPGTIVSVCGETGRVFLGEKSGAATSLPEVEVVQQWAQAEEATPNASDGTGAGPATDVDVMACLRLIALKGMASADALTESFGLPSDAAQDALDTLVEDGLLEALNGGRMRPTDAGKAVVADLLDADRNVGSETCDAALTPFHPPNLALKEVVTAWQMRDVDGEQQPNDHSDSAYDEAVIDRLRKEVHGPIGPILADLTEVLPRLDRYGTRLNSALEKLGAGDQRYMAHPLLDSYHTVWFELHEELIRISGRNRKAETEAGRA